MNGVEHTEPWPWDKDRFASLTTTREQRQLYELRELVLL
jgi:hypothetical protein